MKYGYLEYNLIGSNFTALKVKKFELIEEIKNNKRYLRIINYRK